MSGSSLDLLGVNLAGGDFGSVGQAYGTGYTYPTHAEIDYEAAKGMNVIRLPFLWERLQPALGGPLDPTELARIDDVVNYATSKGLEVDLDAHNYGKYDGRLIGGDAVPNSAFANLWGQLAAHYAANPGVIYGLMNEPQQSSATEWLQSVNTAIAAIRASGGTQEILVPGIGYDGAWTWTTGPNATVMGQGVVDPLNNYAFEVHQYLDSDGSGTHRDVVSSTVGSQRLQDITGWAESTGHRLFLGEFGVAGDSTSVSALGDMLSYMSAHTDAWQGGTYWAAGPWWGDFMYSAEPSNGVDKPQMTVLEQFEHHAEATATPPPVPPTPTAPDPTPPDMPVAPTIPAAPPPVAPTSTTPGTSSPGTSLVPTIPATPPPVSPTPTTPGTSSLGTSIVPTIPATPPSVSTTPAPTAPIVPATTTPDATMPPSTTAGTPVVATTNTTLDTPPLAATTVAAPGATTTISPDTPATPVVATTNTTPDTPPPATPAGAMTVVSPGATATITPDTPATPVVATTNTTPDTPPPATPLAATTVVSPGATATITPDTPATDSSAPPRTSDAGTPAVLSSLTAPSTAAPSLTVDPGLAFTSPTAVTVTGTVSDPAASVDVVAGTRDLGPATVASNGTWSLRADLPAGSYDDLRAVATDAEGLAGSTVAPFDITTGISGRPYTASSDAFGSDAQYAGTTEYGRRGMTYLQWTETQASNGTVLDAYTAGSALQAMGLSALATRSNAQGSIVSSTQSVLAGGHRALSATEGSDIFVFQPGLGHDAVTNFTSSGPAHDTLSLPASEFSSFAQVLSDLSSSGTDTVLSAPDGGGIRLVGVSLSDVSRRDFRFHA